jgi:hypothetical protein
MADLLDKDEQVQQRFRDDVRASLVDQLVPAAGGSIEHAQTMQQYREHMAQIDAECVEVVYDGLGTAPRRGRYFNNAAAAEAARFAADKTLARLGVAKPPPVQPVNAAHAELEASWPTEFRSIHPNMLALYDREVDKALGPENLSFDRERDDLVAAFGRAKSPGEISVLLGQISEASTRVTAARPNQLKAAIAYTRDTGFSDQVHESGVNASDLNRGVFSSSEAAMSASRREFDRLLKLAEHSPQWDEKYAVSPHALRTFAANGALHQRHREARSRIRG